MTTVRLAPTYIGQVGNIGVYRIDLSQSGLSTFSTVTIHDDNVISGLRGKHSGFDLDFVKFSATATHAPKTAMSLAGEPVFDFTSGVAFQPGFLQPLEPGDDPAWNANLLGTIAANVYSPDASTLGVAAGRTNDIGALSLGEGGSLTLLLQTALSTSGRYLYFGDVGEIEGSYVLVSDEAGATEPISPAPMEFTLVGTSGDDIIVLGEGPNAHLRFTNNTVFGQAGNDLIYGALGKDTLHGGPGRDKLNGREGNDWLYGGTGNDRLTGGPGDDWLFGQAGNDLLSGGSGKDWMSGGTGRDTLNGGTGQDGFVFDTKLSARFNVDRIYAFSTRDDSIYLDNAIFKTVGKGSLAAPLKISKTAFWTGDAAHDASDRVIYDRIAGTLSYDPDGTGPAAQVKFAQLSPGSRMTYHDIFVI